LIIPWDKIILITFVVLFVILSGYIGIRLFFKAFFQSYFEAKLDFLKTIYLGGKKDGVECKGRTEKTVDGKNEAKL
jgi:hypothetical protein